MIVHPADSDFDAWEAARREAPGFFADGPVFAARAPVCLDMLGGFTEYSGGRVVSVPLAASAVVGAQRDEESGGAVVVRRAGADGDDLAAEVTFSADAFVNPTAILKELLSGPENARWAGRVAGSIALLRAEGLVPRGAGARFFVRATVPPGTNAISAALTVAALRAACAAFDVPMDGPALARLAQRIENDVMDNPSGIADPLAGARGEAGRLLVLLCQPYQIEETLALPDSWSLLATATSSPSADPTTVLRARTAAFMGYKMLADRAGSGFGGYLCNVSPDEYRGLMPDRLPETMSGAAFLGAHGGIFDSVTSVNPADDYPVRVCAEHAIFEHERVRRFTEAVQTGDDAARENAGTQMLASHESQRACGLIPPETDLLVNLAREQGAAGARATGDGDTVAVLVHARDEERIAAALAADSERRVLRGTSPGALQTLVRTS